MTLYLAREIDLAVPTARQTLDKILVGYERSGGSWEAGINTGYFDSARAYGDIVFWSRRLQDNYQPWPYLIIGLDGRARVAEASPRIDPASVRHAIQIGPMLVRDGRPTDIGAEISKGRYTGLRPADSDRRTIIGVRADGRVVAGVINGTMADAQRALLDAGCVWGLYSDGGGSSALIVKGRGTQIGSLSRTIPAAIVLRGIEPVGAQEKPQQAPQDSSGLPITVDLLPVGHALRPGARIDPRYITVHSTANTNKGADALAHARYLRNGAGGRKVSWHYTVDDRRIVQHLPIDEMGWHAGTSAGNSQSIGIEICENADGDAETAVDLAARLVAHLCRILGLRLDAVVPHQHWSGKHCPRLILERPGGWQGFIGLVAAHMSSGGTGPDVPEGVMGQRGPAVVAVQRLLNRRHGASLVEDGIWGPKTDAAYRAALHG